MQKPGYFKTTLAVCGATGLLIATSASADGEHAKHGSHSDMMVKMMDANQDGKITSDEHAAGAKKMFERMDANKDGQVSETEMSDHHREMMSKHHGKGMKEMSSAEKIRTVDSNEDGLLTAQEHAVASKQMFGQMDKDQDGALTAAEIDAGHKKMMSSSGAHDH
jgi:Ca2+-binding EF-hand superfamily protein